ncbi:MAG: hypothetical protein F6K47_42755 [Symploca sp. SIO2E6]|nr:hypothetical protein [Symploca sp. SIO2E6]
MNPKLLENVNGPSLILVPEWLPKPLGKYYLYFAHHGGKSIRLAYADQLKGPWKIHAPGTLQLEQTPYHGHIASPDVHIDQKRQQIRMYYHGPIKSDSEFGKQRTSMATSRDGLVFDNSSEEDLGPFYFRMFEHQEYHYAIAKDPSKPGGGVLLRSKDGFTPFEKGPEILPRMRHAAILRRSRYIDIFYSRGEDAPERILISRMALDGDWQSWSPGPPSDVLKPEFDYEGANLPLAPSRFGASFEPVHQLRDPDIFEDRGRIYLTYSCAGETSIAMAELRIR